MLKETQTKLKLTWWPTPQDYNEAIQITCANLQDPVLQQGLVYTDCHGLPRPVTGSFASVYRFHCQDNDFALRLFLRNISDQEERYALISDFVQHDDLPYTVTFDFLRSGIKVMGEWLPALKMEWVDGISLDDYIVENLGNPEKLGQLADKFMTMMKDLSRAGIAHGDLQHGNIIVWNNELRLVDYDGMFVPAMQGLQANELGHRNYQHPERAAKHFGPYLDNFSAWVIYASIKALQIDSRLLHQLGGGDDCLLFKQTDFLDPLHSPAFAALEQHQNEELRALGRFLRFQLKCDPAAVPPLESAVPYVAESKLESLSQGVGLLRCGPRLVRGTLPDWLEKGNATALSTGKDSSSSQTTETSKEQSWTVPLKAAPTTQWTKPAPAASASSTASAAASAAAGATKPAVTYELPPELRIKPMRNVKFYEQCGHMRPELSQLLLIPLLWTTIFVAIGGLAPAFITTLLFSLIPTLIMELVVWFTIFAPAENDKRFAREGTAGLARVLDCIKSTGPLGEPIYYVTISFYYQNNLVKGKLSVSASEFAALKRNDVEPILYDPVNPYAVVLYKFCRYHPVRRTFVALPSGPGAPPATSGTPGRKRKSKSGRSKP